jgi:hypothetical protein
MYWYILIFSILALVILSLRYHEGFVDRSISQIVVNTLSDTYPESDLDLSSPINNSFNSNAFHKKSKYFIESSMADPTNTLLGDIQFCKNMAYSNDPFSNQKFADTCGICMTQGTILLNQAPFSYEKNRKGTGVVVYKEDKVFSRNERTQAIPSSHSAFCDALLIDRSSATVPLTNVTGLAIDAQQYTDTLAYLRSTNILSFQSGSNCTSLVSQPVVCPNNNTTISSMRFLYGHFSDGCEAGSPRIRTEVVPPGCIGLTSCTVSSNLPVGQRQWFLDAECTVKQESIPPGLTPMNRRSIESYYTNANGEYYWAGPFSSEKDNITKFTLYGSCTVSQDTQVKIEYHTTASFDLYLHTIKQFSQTNPGANLFSMSSESSPSFTLYKGSNVIKLNVSSTNRSYNGLSFTLRDSAGTPLRSLDSTWVYSIPSGFRNPVVGPATFPVNVHSINGASWISPKATYTRTINYFKTLTMTTEQKLNVLVKIMNMTSPKNSNDRSSSYTLYITFDGLEKEVLSSSKSRQSYTEFFPVGTSSLRISVNGRDDTAMFLSIVDEHGKVLLTTDNSWTSDEPPPPIPAPPAPPPPPPPPVIIPPPRPRGPVVKLREHCDNYSGRSFTLDGPGTYNVSTDFPSDSSYIEVPNGLTAELTASNGKVKIVQGPGSYIFCEDPNGSFNDKTVKIVVRTTPIPPPPPVISYDLQDFVTWTAAGTDLPNQPMTGTVQQCQASCTGQSSCVGFSRYSYADPNSAQQCWLKRNIDNKSPRQVYKTYVKKIS